MPMSVLDVSVDWFKTVFSDRSAGKPVNLINMLTSDRYLADQERVIAVAHDKDKKDYYKSMMPVFTPSMCAGHHTGLMAIDIDGHHNPGLDMAWARREIRTIPQVAYCGRSVSATGLWLLMPISDPGAHKAHFLAAQDLFNGLGINIDAGKNNPKDVRFYSYDPSPYFNHDAEKYTCIRKPPQAPQYRSYSNEYPVNINVDRLLQKHGWQYSHQSNTHTFWIRPGKYRAHGATVRKDNNVFYCFTSSTQFDPGRGYSPLSVYAILEHGGNFDKALQTIKIKLYEFRNGGRAVEG